MSFLDFQRVLMKCITLKATWQTPFERRISYHCVGKNCKGKLILQNFRWLIGSKSWRMTWQGLKLLLFIFLVFLPWIKTWEAFKALKSSRFCWNRSWTTRIQSADLGTLSHCPLESSGSGALPTNHWWHRFDTNLTVQMVKLHNW